MRCCCALNPSATKKFTVPFSTRPAIDAGLLACILLLSACKPSANPPTPTPTPTPTPAPAPPPAATVPADNNATPTAVAYRVVDQLFQADTIGMRLTAVNQLAGPALHSEQHRHLHLWTWAGLRQRRL